MRNPNMFKKGYLDNGIPIVMEKVEGVRSVAAGVWVKVGSRFEALGKNGISHFVEHMFFKGTKNRSQKDIAIEIDSLGGDLNAFTSRENTTFYVKLLGDYVEKGVDILADIFLNSLFREEDIEKEKEIITEEIMMVEDTPDDYIHDLFYQDIWGLKELGMPVLGTTETVSSFVREDLMSHLDSYYCHNDVVISCAGNLDFDSYLHMFNGKFGGTKDASSCRNKKISTPPFGKGLNVYEKDHSEVHVCIGVEGVKQDSELRYPFLVLNTIFGAGVSSRLFQEIRETRGLVYTIYSFLSSYHDTGVFGIYAGAGKKKYVEVIETVIREMASLKETIDEKEIDRAKNQLKGNLLLTLESSSGRMQNIARQEIYYGRYYPPEDIIKGIEKVGKNDVIGIIDTFLTSGGKAITVLGPATADELSAIV
jgi:predicted Zn-dependent peptidase